MAIDVCVVSSLQSQLVNTNRAAVEPGYALQYRYGQKWLKYGEVCAAEGISFQPLPLEVLGGLHDLSVLTVKKLGEALARAGGQGEQEVVRHLFGRLSVLLMRGNATLILSRVPKHPDPHINGIH